MKVLHLSSEKTWRGGEQQIAYLIDELQKYDVQNYVACRTNSAFEKHCKEYQIEHISIPFANNFDINSAFQIKNFCKYMKIDIIHMHSSRSHTLAVIASLLGANVNLILSRRVDFPSAGNWLSKFKYNYSGIKKILCVSDKIKEVISPIIKNKNKLEVIYSGIDLKRFEGKINQGILHKEFNLDSETKIAANISAIAPHKDYYTFVDTVEEFKKINNQNVKFFIIGEGNCRKDIEKYIAEKKLTDDIILTGFRTDIASILPEIDVFLITSEEEGLGTTVLDAIANKIPVVATAGGGIPEMIKNEETGLLYIIKDSEGLSNGVQRILSDEDLKNKLIDSAYQLLLEKFTKDITAKKTLEVYKRYC